MIHLFTALFFRVFNRRLKLGKKVKIDPRAFVARGGHVSLGDESVVRAGAMLLPSGGRIDIGNRVSLNHYCVLNGEGGIRIGNDVLIAAFTGLFAANHVFDRTDVPIREQGMVSRGGIVIEDDVWIGTHSVILDGVTVGRGSVIAAGAIVTEDVEAFMIVAGVPAKPVRSRLTRE